MQNLSIKTKKLLEKHRKNLIRDQRKNKKRTRKILRCSERKEKIFPIEDEIVGTQIEYHIERKWAYVFNGSYNYFFNQVYNFNHIRGPYKALLHDGYASI